MAEYKFWQRREAKNMKVAKIQKAAAAAAATNILEAIAQLSSSEAEDGPKKMKIVVKKEELKQVLEAIRQRRSTLVRPMSLDQRLNFMRRRQILRAAARTRSASWRPVLQSIPEEL